MTQTTDAQLSEWGRAIVARRWARRHPATCAICGKPFEAKDNQLYCSPACANRALYLRHRQLAPRPLVTCPVCGAQFEARGTQIYDTRECARLGQAAKAKAERAQRKRQEAPA